MDFEGVLCSLYKQIIKPPLFDLRQDHLGQLLILLLELVIEL